MFLIITTDAGFFHKDIVGRVDEFLAWPELGRVHSSRELSSDDIQAFEWVEGYFRDSLALLLKDDYDRIQKEPDSSLFERVSLNDKDRYLGCSFRALILECLNL
jgi:hypothetical protein